MLIIITNQLTSCSNHQPVTQTTIKPLYNTQVNTQSITELATLATIKCTTHTQTAANYTPNHNCKHQQHKQPPTSSNIPSNNALATEMLANNHIKKGQVKYRNLSQNTSTQGLTKQYETPQTITSFTQTQ
eukprot:gene13091-8937_t